MATQTKSAEKAPDFIVHEGVDSVGVVVVEGIKAGQELTGWVMDKDRTIGVKVLNDIPIGHKVALNDLSPNDDVIKYNVVIGRVVAPIKAGEHVHVHNLKTRRW